MELSYTVNAHSYLFIAVFEYIVGENCIVFLSYLNLGKSLIRQHGKTRLSSSNPCNASSTEALQK